MILYSVRWLSSYLVVEPGSDIGGHIADLGDGDGGDVHGANSGERLPARPRLLSSPDTRTNRFNYCISM